MEKQTQFEKAKLEEKKLELEIANLGRSFRNTLTIAVLSASVPMTIAVIGWTFQRGSEQTAAMRTEQYRREDEYNKAMEDLGSPNPSLRISAAKALSKLTNPGNKDAVDAMIRAFVVRLEVESDSTIQEQIIHELAILGKPALTEVVKANRRAAAQFTRDSAEVAALVVARSKLQRGAIFAPWPDNLILKEWNNQIKAVNSAFERESSAAPASDISFLHLFMFLYSEQFGSQLNIASERAKSTKVGQMDEAIQAANNTFRRSARFLMATSIIIEQALRALSGQLKSEKLDRIVLLWADFRKLNLRGLSIQNSFINADVSDSDLSFCDFSHSVMVDMRVARAKFRGANLNLAIIPAALEWTTQSDYPDLTGANWWQSYEIRPQTNEPQQPEWLEESLPQHTQSIERQKLLKEWESENH